MTENEISEFIERMEEINDIWEAEDVARVYGNCSLEDALSRRQNELSLFFGIIDKVINRKTD